MAASYTPALGCTPALGDSPLAASVAAEAYLLDVAAAVAAAPDATSEHLVVGARKHSWKGAPRPARAHPTPPPPPPRLVPTPC